MRAETREKGLDHLLIIKHLCRMGHKLSLADLEHYRAAALLYAVKGVLTKDADCIAFFNGLTPEQAGNLRGYYAPKLRERAPGLFSAPSAENRACKKVAKDIEVGLIYYSKYLVTAAESGLAEARWLLGLVYGPGKGVEKNLAETFRWYERAAREGNAEGGFYAGFKLIRETAPKYERARKYLEKHNPDSPENP